MPRRVFDVSALEAAIILIAFVIIAAVFSYMVYGVRLAGTESTIQVVGDVYGLAADPSSGINEIRFSIRLVPGAEPVNLTGMKIVFSTPATNPVMLSHGAYASTSVFTTKLDGAGESVGTMAPGQQMEIDFFVAAVPSNRKMTFDLRPPVGSLTFSRTSPATITNTTILG